MLDVHIIPHPEDRRDWLAQAVQSVPSWAKLHFGRYVEGNVGKARLAAYRQGCEKYVSFVDPDDYWHEGTLERLVEECNTTGVVAAFCKERVLNLKNSTEQVHHRPHKGVYKRKYIEKHAKFFVRNTTATDIGLARIAYLFNGAALLPFVGHTWRVYGSKAEKFRLPT